MFGEAKLCQIVNDKWTDYLNRDAIVARFYPHQIIMSIKKAHIQ